MRTSLGPSTRRAEGHGRLSPQGASQPDKTKKKASISTGAWEEARARIELDGLLAAYSVARIDQVQILYRARLLDEAVEPGPESLEVALLGWGLGGFALHALRARSSPELQASTWAEQQVPPAMSCRARVLARW